MQKLSEFKVKIVFPLSDHICPLILLTSESD